MEKALRSASSRGHGISIFELPEEQASIFQEACVVYEGNQRSDLSALEELAQGKQAMHRTLSNSRTTDDFAQESKKSVTHYQETLFDCNTCGSSFFNNAAFRAHCQSEWHVHNVRLRANNKAPVTNQEYTRVQDLLSNPPSRRNKKKKKKKKGHNNSTSADAKAAMESVDGSLQEEGEEWNDDDDDNWWSDDQEVEEEEDTEEGKGDIGSFAVGFTTGGEDSGGGVAFAMYKSLLLGPADRKIHLTTQARHRAIVVQLRRLPALTSYAVLMTSGGKFAGAVYNKGTCVLHKAFKKYVIRAKQGGLQAAKDNKGQAKKSIGAEMRRQNMKIFSEQVQSLLEEWRPRLAECQLLLVYAPGKLNKRILFVSKDKDVLSRADPRLRYPHFDTNQAGVTFSGVQHMVKTTMRVYPVSADVLTQTFTS